MKKVFLILLMAFVSVTIINSCGGSKEFKPAEVTKLAEHKDAVFTFSYPENWIKSVKQNEMITAFSSEAGKIRFAKTEPEGDLAAMFSFKAVKLNPGEDIEAVVKQNKAYDASIYSAPQKIMVDGVELNKETYKYELKDGVFEGEIYYGTKDGSFLSVIIYEAFGGTFANLKPSIEQSLKATKLATMPVKTEGQTQVVKVEAPPPSANLTKMNGDGYSIGIPDNFELNRGARKAAGVLSVNDYVGDRRADCNIMIEVLDGKDANLEKISNTLAGKLGGAARATNLSGEKAFAFDYSPVAGVKGRMTLALKNGKLYRVTINWAKDEEPAYKPVFEKSLGSFKFN